MKVQLEQAELKEPEVIVRGDLSSNEGENIADDFDYDPLCYYSVTGIF